MSFAARLSVMMAINLCGLYTNFAAFTGARHVIGCANGTDAIEISLRALEIGAGDEVIVPAMTWISTASAVLPGHIRIC